MGDNYVVRIRVVVAVGVSGGVGVGIFWTGEVGFMGIIVGVGVWRLVGGGV